LLRERSDHGYDLVSRLRELHVVDGDAGAVYRSLRGLERNGLVRSSWQTSDAGPARRTYQVTSAGIADLNRQAVLLEATHQPCTCSVTATSGSPRPGSRPGRLGCPDRGRETAMSTAKPTGTSTAKLTSPPRARSARSRRAGRQKRSAADRARERAGG